MYFNNYQDPLQCVAMLSMIIFCWFPSFSLLHKSLFGPHLCCFSWCSDATRTKETLQILQETAIGFSEAEVYFMPSFYSVAAMDGQTAEHLQSAICEYSRDESLTVMWVRHTENCCFCCILTFTFPAIVLSKFYCLVSNLKSLSFPGQVHGPQQRLGRSCFHVFWCFCRAQDM